MLFFFLQYSTILIENSKLLSLFTMLTCIKFFPNVDLMSLKEERQELNEIEEKDQCKKNKDRKDFLTKKSSEDQI